LFYLAFNLRIACQGRRFWITLCAVRRGHQW